MPVASMTGFARSEGADERMQWAWEARSVNGRSLDIRLRLPPGSERFDPIVRKAVQDRFKRGNLTVNLELKSVTGTAPMGVNETFLDALIAQCETRGETPRIDALLAVRGVVEPVEEAETDPTLEESRNAAIVTSLLDVLDRLAEARVDEGSRIAAVISDHLGEIETQLETAERSAESTPQAIRNRITMQLRDLLPEDNALPSERLAQEAAILAVKADVREEQDRLKAHIEAARDLLREGVGIGRRFDFLCQEFNREANTLGSKSAALELTRIGLDLKAVIDRLREQVQNLE